MPWLGLSMKKDLATATEIGDKELIASDLAGLACVAALQGELTWAVRLWASADTLRETLDAPLHPIERADYEQALVEAKDHLGDSAFDDAWAQGQLMTLEQVLATR